MVRFGPLHDLAVRSIFNTSVVGFLPHLVTLGPSRHLPRLAGPFFFLRPGSAAGIDADCIGDWGSLCDAVTPYVPATRTPQMVYASATHRETSDRLSNWHSPGLCRGIHSALLTQC